MKLLFIIDNLGPGGAQRQMVNLARGLLLKGHKIEFFVYYSDSHYKGMLDELSIPVHLFHKKSRYDLSPIFKIRKLILKNKYDVTLAFLDTPNFYAEVAHIAIKKTKLIVSDRLAFPGKKISIKFKVLLALHVLANRVIVNSHHHRMQIEKEFPCLRTKIQTIYNGCDLGVFRPTKKKKFKEDGALSLIAVSSVSFKKNSINLAKALHICKTKYKLDVHVTWIGSTSVSGLRTSFEETTAYLKSFGLDKYWVWGGVRQDIPSLLVQHDALIHPSYYEGLPNAVCEALACGKPVLISDVCDHPILVEDGIRGYLFTPYDPNDIALSILKIYNATSSEYEQMCINARLFAEENLSMSRYISSYESLFFSVRNE